MLWIAIAAVMKIPSSLPPPNETPTPTPSATECTVMTAMIVIAVRASAAAELPEVHVVVLVEDALGQRDERDAEHDPEQ